MYLRVSALSVMALCLGVLVGCATTSHRVGESWMKRLSSRVYRVSFSLDGGTHIGSGAVMSSSKSGTLSLSFGPGAKASLHIDEKELTVDTKIKVPPNTRRTSVYKSRSQKKWEGTYRFLAKDKRIQIMLRGKHCQGAYCIGSQKPAALTIFCQPHQVRARVVLYHRRRVKFQHKKVLRRGLLCWSKATSPRRVDPAVVYEPSQLRYEYGRNTTDLLLRLSLFADRRVKFNKSEFREDLLDVRTPLK